MMWRALPRCVQIITTAVEVTRADETRLAIIEPVVDDRCGAAVEYLASAREIQPAMPTRQLTLRRIEGDVHTLIVPPINVKEWIRPRKLGN